MLLCFYIDPVSIVTDARWTLSTHTLHTQKLVKATKCLHAIRTLRQERYNQEELDYPFQSIFMLSFFVWFIGSTGPPLLHFLDRCYKRRYISRKLNIRELLEKSDCGIFWQTLRTNSLHCFPRILSIQGSLLPVPTERVRGMREPWEWVEPSLFRAWIEIN